MIPIVTELQFENEVIQRLALRIRKYTPIIFSQVTEKDELKHLASSILLKWKDGYFIVLTSHTTTKGKFFTSCGEGFFSVDGPKGVLKNADVKVIRLNQNHIDEFLANGFEFFDLNKVGIQHDDLKGMKYLIVGYPNSRVKKLSKKSKDWKTKMFVFRTRALNDKNLVKQLRVDSKTHLVLRYEKKSIYNIATHRKEKGPDLEGLSGCGIWRIPTLRNVYNDVNFLNIMPTAMIIKENPRNDALIGTRLSVIVNALNKFLDEMEEKGLDIDNLPDKYKLD